MNELHVYTNGEEWVIAASHDDADKLCEELGMGSNYAADTSQWVLCDPLKQFTFDDGNTIETKTYGEWAALKGRCYFANGDY